MIVRGTVFWFTTNAANHDEVHVTKGNVDVRTVEQDGVTDVPESDAVCRPGRSLISIPSRLAVFPQADDLVQLHSSKDGIAFES